MSDLIFDGGKKQDKQAALRVILAHEEIPYSVGLGPNGIVIIVETKYRKKTLKALAEWRDAVNELEACFGL